jgi:hypothetical protein
MVVTGCADVSKIRNDLQDGQNIMFNHLWLQRSIVTRESEKLLIRFMGEAQSINVCSFRELVPAN